MTIERPMFPPTRRNLLTVSAGALALALIPPQAHAAIDPVFELIEIHRKAHIAHLASLELQARSERRHGIGAASWISAKPCDDENEAFTAFVAEPAVTMQGLLAKLAYFEELAGDFETEWMVRDRAEAAVLIQSFAASLRNIGVQP